MAVTLQTVADRAGVSMPTVSHILSAKSKRAGLFAEETRRRVRQVADELGYRPNAAARSTATGRFGAVALLQSTFQNRSILPDQLVAGIDSVLGQHEMHLTLARLSDEKLTSPTYVPRILRQLTSDGLLINYNAHIPQRMIELLEQFKLPSVWINSQHEHDCVYPDDEKAGYDATRVLLEAGHTRIAFVDYTYGRQSQSRHYSNPARQAGYARAMAEAGHAPRLITGETDIPYPDRLNFTAEWINAEDRPTAVITYGSREVDAIVATAGRMGLRLPEHLSIIGVHDEPIRHFDLTVATMVLPEFEIGRRATAVLLEKIEDPTYRAPPVRVALELEPGDTLSPALS
ncbi:MAG: LacI family DNA-binding transcriptional regulator [Phycisphaerae bacterium]